MDSNGDIPKDPVSPASQSATRQADNRSIGSIDSPRQLQPPLPQNEPVGYQEDSGLLTEGRPADGRGSQAIVQESGEDLSCEVGGVIVPETPPQSGLIPKSTSSDETIDRLVGADRPSVLGSSSGAIEFHECPCGDRFTALDDLQVHQVHLNCNHKVMHMINTICVTS